MDLVYMSDVMAYHTIRGPVYDKYDTWDQAENSTRTQTKNLNNQPKKNKDKEPCKICQERQRRSLMKYIRSKSHDHSEQEIKEEEEEEEAQVEKEQKEETKR